MKSLIHYLFFQYWNYRKLSLGIMLTMIVTLIYTSSFSLSIKYIIDEIILLNQHFDKLAVILVVLLAGFIVHISCTILRDFWIAKISTAMQIDSRLLLFNHIQRLPASFYERMSRGSLTSRFTTDLAAVHAAFMTFVPAFYSIMSLIFYLVLIATLHWSLAVLSIVGMLLSLSIPQLMSRKAIETSDTVKIKQTSLMDIIQEHFSVQSVVRAYGLSHWQLSRLKSASEEQKPLTIRAHFLSRSMPTSVSNVLLLWNLLSIFIGAYLCLTNAISIGILIAFQSFFISISQQLKLLSEHLPQLLSSSLSYNRINNLLSEKFGEDELPSQPVLSVNQLNQEIRLSQVSFSYPADARNVIEKLNICVPAYNYTAIVGMNGSGKSTIISLLMRFYDPSDGQVELDGTDTRRLSAAAIREMTGYVSQENILFNLSIKDNILLGKPNASDEEVDAAARSAGIYDWILGLPDGYRTVCGENGRTLSGGQRQRVAIARALIRKPNILVLDEAASALDPENEDILYQSLHELIGTRTIINVTHRLSSVKDADQIILMDNGKVRDSGSHEQLLSRCDMYQSMWRKQSGFVFTRESRSVKVEVDRLRDIELFKGLDLDLLEYLSESLITEFVYMGETVVEHGEEGNKFYIIVRGQVEVLKFFKGEQEMKRAAVLSDGDHFGEISLMLSMPRTATIRTLTPCTFLTIQRDQFQTMLDKASPRLREMLEDECHRRLVY